LKNVGGASPSGDNPTFLGCWCGGVGFCLRATQPTDLKAGAIISMFFAIACNAHKPILGQFYRSIDYRYTMRENRQLSEYIF
jgi:hypothetical protein